MKYTDRELRLLALVPTNGARVSTLDLVNGYYGSERPLNARTIVTSRMTGIMAKMAHAKDPLPLQKSRRTGPKPIEYWRAAR